MSFRVTTQLSLPRDWSPTDAELLQLALEDSGGEAVEWQALALCKETDPEAFYPDKGGSTRAAKNVCRDCPVTAECLEYALANEERFGIWGGLSERERRPLKKKRRQATVARAETAQVEEETSRP